MLNIIQHLFLFCIGIASGRAEHLSSSLTEMVPTISKNAAWGNAAGAMWAETPDISAELLLGLAYVESRYTPEATSRVTGAVRSTGVPPWRNPPDDVHGPYFCGVTQVQAGMSWGKCLELRGLANAYLAAAHELTLWLTACHRTGTDNLLACSLWGYGGGFPMIKQHSSTYPSRVLFRMEMIRRLLHRSQMT